MSMYSVGYITHPARRCSAAAGAYRQKRANVDASAADAGARSTVAMHAISGRNVCASMTLHP
ncbi:hypothetical protein PSAB6_70393 [Paraburkholderia sabiae]|nr:hypothetical protein PSAB6_70393 [Paraburkholderia sabiae]